MKITELDRRRLGTLIQDAYADSIQRRDQVYSLEAELEGAQVVSPDELPEDVITMSSTVRLRDLDRDISVTYTLVYPDDADLRQARLSVFDPLGVALIGYQVGDTIECRTPEGLRRFRIDEVHR
ncbi:MAG: GreA/GreB family elongation factor [Pirellulales bacterium]